MLERWFRYECGFVIRMDLRGHAKRLSKVHLALNPQETGKLTRTLFMINFGCMESYIIFPRQSFVFYSAAMLDVMSVSSKMVAKYKIYICYITRFSWLYSYKCYIAKPSIFIPIFCMNIITTFWGFFGGFFFSDLDR